jgi:transcriptional regulator with XRE-family HTH domain
MAKKKRGRPRVAGTEIDVGARIRQRRTQLQMSQKDLSRRAGVSVRQIQKYENGLNGIAASRLPSLAKALDISLAFFFDNSDSGRTAESDLFLDTTDKVRLARAYSRIQNQKIHRELIRLVEALAQRMPTKRRHKAG